MTRAIRPSNSLTPWLALRRLIRKIALIAITMKMPPAALTPVARKRKRISQFLGIRGSAGKNKVPRTRQTTPPKVRIPYVGVRTYATRRPMPRVSRIPAKRFVSKSPRPYSPNARLITPSTSGT